MEKIFIIILVKCLWNVVCGAQYNLAFSDGSRPNCTLNKELAIKCYKTYKCLGFNDQIFTSQKYLKKNPFRGPVYLIKEYEELFHLLAKINLADTSLPIVITYDNYVQYITSDTTFYRNYFRGTSGFIGMVNLQKRLRCDNITMRINAKSLLGEISVVCNHLTVYEGNKVSCTTTEGKLYNGTYISQTELEIGSETTLCRLINCQWFDLERIMADGSIYYQIYINNKINCSA
ncbi:hypothetical protein SNEBB_005322 [Seison nebaliae]|nr:hypothetical protein SNEBB_005322 [Seison nebaliae]